MTIQIVWSIEAIKIRQDQIYGNNVVSAITWKCTAKEDEVEIYTRGESILPNQHDPEIEFVEFENLTEENVVAWAKEFLVGTTTDKIEDYTKEILEKAKNPSTTESPQLPWQISN